MATSYLSSLGDTFTAWTTGSSLTIGNPAYQASLFVPGGQVAGALTTLFLKFDLDFTGTGTGTIVEGTANGVTATGWNRYACYLNGTPQSAGHHTFVDVTAEDCALIQTGSSSTTTLVRCAELGSVSNGGSFFKGPVLSVESLWGSTGTIGLLPGVAHDRRFVGDVFCGPSYWVACGANTTGTVTMTDCTLNLGARSSAVQITNRSTVAARLVACTINGTPRWVVNVEGGTVDFVDMPTPTPIRVVAPGAVI